MGGGMTKKMLNLNTCIISKQFKSVYDKLICERYVKQDWGSTAPIIPTVCV